MELEVSAQVERFIKCNIWNGRNASFGFDNWNPFGSLIKYVDIDGSRTLRVPLNAKVFDVWYFEGWKIANPRSEQGLSLHIHLTTVSQPTEDKGPDSFDWVWWRIKAAMGSLLRIPSLLLEWGLTGGVLFSSRDPRQSTLLTCGLQPWTVFLQSQDLLLGECIYKQHVASVLFFLRVEICPVTFGMQLTRG